MKFLILNAKESHKGYATQRLVEEAEARQHGARLIDPAEVYLFVSDKNSGYDRLYVSNDEDKPEKIFSKDIDCIIPRLGINVTYGTNVLEHLTINMGIWSPQSKDGIHNASNKFDNIQRMSAFKLRTPKTFFAQNPIHIDWLIEQIGGLPAIAKTIQGSQGKGVMILETPLAANTALESFYKSKIDLILQQFIDYKNDIRAIVMGREVVASMERVKISKDFRANASLGAKCKKITLSEDEKDFCIKCAEATGLEVAGVDILKDFDGNTYAIEVNSKYPEPGSNRHSTGF
jgi:ribosomal protein S6--L-glutamate ligase